MFNFPLLIPLWLVFSIPAMFEDPALWPWTPPQGFFDDHHPSSPFLHFFSLSSDIFPSHGTGDLWSTGWWPSQTFLSPVETLGPRYHADGNPCIDLTCQVEPVLSPSSVLGNCEPKQCQVM